MILQITAAYKPAYIYGGPTMSVAKLCETLVGNCEQYRSSTVDRLSSEEKPETNKPDKSSTVRRSSSVELIETKNEKRKTAGNNEIFQLEVFTTTANGKTELDVTPDETTIVDGVKVTYFTRLTKDHTHFSPALLWALRKEILRSAQNDKMLVVHIHAWWNLVSIFSCAIAKWYHIPVVLSPRGMLTAYTANNRNSLAKRIIHSVLGKSLLTYCHIHTTSEKEKRDVLSIIKPKSITIIPNLVELGNEKSSIVHRPSFEEATNNEQRLTSNEQSSTVYRKSLEEGTKNEQRTTNNDYRPSLDETMKNEQLTTKNDNRPSFEETTNNEQRATNNKQSSSVYRKSLEEETTNEQRTTNNEHLPFKLIFLSRIEEKKGLELLFEALSTIPFDWNLTIAGSGEKIYVESLKLKVKSLKIEDRINWLGQVKNEDKFKLLAKHDLMVLTSYNENFANVVIESLSVGTPILLSNEVGLADYVEVKKLGWITDLRPENIKHSIITAFESVNLRALIRETAPQIISKDFDSENLIQKYFTLYSQIN